MRVINSYCSLVGYETILQSVRWVPVFQRVTPPKSSGQKLLLFRSTYFLLLQGESHFCHEDGGTFSSKMLVPIYQTIQHHNLDIDNITSLNSQSPFPSNPLQLQGQTHVSNDSSQSSPNFRLSDRNCHYESGRLHYSKMTIH
jgi:hypothetical protein